MEISILNRTDAAVISTLLLLLMILCTFLGFNTGKWKRKSNPENEKIADTTGLTGLLFFLLAFTFGMSGSRFDRRREVVVEEANNIGTALLRADLYPAEERMLFRKDFKDYVEARIEYYGAGANMDKINAAGISTDKIAEKLWSRAARLAADPANATSTRLMIPALNDMIDITTTRISGEKAKVPESIVYMLFFLACITAFFAGYAKGYKGRIDWMVEIGFCVLVALVVLFTLDLDRPRRGFVNLDATNQTIIDLRKNFK
jgi:hypothetical protein